MVRGKVKNGLHPDKFIFIYHRYRLSCPLVPSAKNIGSEDGFFCHRQPGRVYDVRPGPLAMAGNFCMLGRRRLDILVPALEVHVRCSLPFVHSYICIVLSFHHDRKSFPENSENNCAPGKIDPRRTFTTDEKGRVRQKQAG